MIGKVCRSPMAEFVMKHITEERNIRFDYEIASAATSIEEIGNHVYPPVNSLLSQNGIDCSEKTARHITKSDMDYYDMIIVMDNNNYSSLQRMFGSRYNNKISFLMDYTEKKRDVADPWYTGDFISTWNDVENGCYGLLRYIEKHKK